MSAPAMNVSGLPEIRTSPLMSEVARHAHEDLLELGGERGAERVHRLVRLIDRDDEYVAGERRT